MNRSAGARIPKRSWIMLGLVALVGLLFIADRQVLSLLKTTLGEEVGLSDLEYGWLVTAFMVPYTVMYLFTGAWVDRGGTRLMLSLCVALMSLATIFTGNADSFQEMLGWRVLLGVAEAGIVPATILFVVIWFPKESRATAVAMKSPIEAVGQVLLPSLVAWLTLTLNWRASFFVPGVIGLAVAIIWWLSDRNPPDYGEERVVEEKLGILGLLRMRAIWPLLAVRIISDPFWFFLLYWYPGFLQEHVGFSMTQLGLWAGIPLLVKGLGNVGIGMFSDRLVGRGVSLQRARSLPLVMVAALAPLAVVLPFVSFPPLVVALLALLNLMCGAWLFLTNVFVADLVPRNALATGVGLLSALGGGVAALFNLAAGWMIENLGYTPLFFIGACLHPVAAFVLWRAYLRPRTAVSAGAVR